MRAADRKRPSAGSSTAPSAGSSLRTSMASSAQPPTRTSFSATGWTWVLTVFVAVVLTAVGWPVLAAIHGLPVAVAMVLSVATAAAPLVAVKWPRIAVAVAAVSALAAALATSPDAGPWPWPVTTMIAFILLTLTVTLLHSWRMGAATWLAGALVGASLCSLAVLFGTTDDLGSAISNAVACAGISAGVLAAGSGVGQLLTSRIELDHERQLTAEEETKRRELQQRNRIAQELHDVVAHSMSVISVQATTAPYRLPGMDEPTQHEFSTIADSSRRALTEMRGLLAVLRGDDAAQTAPQPTVADIPQLVESTRASGATVDLEIDPELLPRVRRTDATGEPDAAGDWSAVVPPATGLTAYRVVQEAVSNALRHAPGAAIRVQVAIGDQIGVRIVNGPATRMAAAATPGAGLGLKGISERVGALGGTVKAGPTPDGGFTVKARLPL